MFEISGSRARWMVVGVSQHNEHPIHRGSAGSAFQPGVGGALPLHSAIHVLLQEVEGIALQNQSSGTPFGKYESGWK